jgi:hypothetical protein
LRSGIPFFAALNPEETAGAGSSGENHGKWLYFYKKQSLQYNFLFI